MISVNKDVSYRSIEDRESSAVLYTDFFSKRTLDLIVKEVYAQSPQVVDLLKTTLLRISGFFYEQKRKKEPVSMVLIFLKEDVFKAKKKTKTLSEPCPQGSVLFLGRKFVSSWTIEKAKFAIHMYEYEEDLSSIYLTIAKRELYAKKVSRELEIFKKEPIWNQCLKKYVSMSYLGKGCYGNVYQVPGKFAVKIAKLKDEAVAHPFDPDVSSWHELYFLQNIIKKIILNRVCPNLPLLYDSFTCGKCILNIEDKEVESPCAITTVELAQGTLKSYLKKHTLTLDEAHSMYFQILAGVSAIQYYGQIMNYDVKKENVLYYDVTPGGFWHYRIRNIDFYVPNYGKLFVLNDFGISRSLSPNLPLYKTKEDESFRLGMRYAIILDNRFTPIIAEDQVNEEGETVKPNEITWDGDEKTTGAEFRMDRKGKLLDVKTNIKVSKTMFVDPDSVPPFEFYNDTQDTIRMFTGEKRTTQSGNHSKPPNIPKAFLKELSFFSGKGENAKQGIFSSDPAQVVASYLIVAFFQRFTDYTAPKTEIIESFLFP